MHFSFFRTEFIKENPFDEVLAGKEDRYWVVDMIKRGYNILYEPTNIVNHFYTLNGATWNGIG